MEGLEIATAPLVGTNEPISALLHLGGALVYGALTVLLVNRARRDPALHHGRFLSFFVFAVSCVSLLAISGAYHWTSSASSWRDPLQRLDHAAIFVLISGTLTPFHVLVFRGTERWVMLGLVWLLAVTAIVMKLLYFDTLQGGLGLALYVGVGAISVVSISRLPMRVPLAALVPFAWGGAAYVAGAVVDVNLPFVVMERFLGAHELFHASVLLGAGLHWFCLIDVGRRLSLPTNLPTNLPTDLPTDSAQRVAADRAEAPWLWTSS